MNVCENLDDFLGTCPFLHPHEQVVPVFAELGIRARQDSSNFDRLESLCTGHCSMSFKKAFLDRDGPVSTNPRGERSGPGGWGPGGVLTLPVQNACPTATCPGALPRERLGGAPPGRDRPGGPRGP